MADARVRIELDSEGAKRKLEAFDAKRTRARKKADKAEKKRATRQKRERRGGLLGAAAGAVVAAKSPHISAIQARAEEAGGTIKQASQMVTKLLALVTAAETVGDTLATAAGALEAQGVAGKIMAEPMRLAAAGLKKAAVPKSLLETARITAGAFAPFAAAGIPLGPEQIAEIAEFAKFQADNKIEEELRNKAKIGRAVGNVIADITGFGG